MKNPFFRLLGILNIPPGPHEPRRRRMMSLSDSLWLETGSGLPSDPRARRGVASTWEVLPSPPPSGWSTGFMATPRTWAGRLPFQRFRPGLADERSAPPRRCRPAPTVARQSMGTRRISVDGSRRVA